MACCKQLGETKKGNGWEILFMTQIDAIIICSACKNGVGMGESTLAILKTDCYFSSLTKNAHEDVVVTRTMVLLERPNPAGSHQLDHTKGASSSVSYVTV